MQDLQRKIAELEADEELARKLAHQDRIDVAADENDDERLARQIAEEEEDRYFATTNQNTYEKQQQAITTGAQIVQKLKSTGRREYNPMNFSNVIIHTKTSKKLAKQISKKLAFQNVTTNNDIDTSGSLSVRRMRAALVPEVRFPHVYDALLDAKYTLGSIGNAKVYLPEDSTRKSVADYEEVTVKKMERTDLVAQEKLISIADNFDAIGRVAFANCKQLNQMQSIVFEAAYKSNFNMLVAAPTGAGKTNVAMMAVMNELRKWFKPNTTQMISENFSERFKIIYIAPMKSLATEQTDLFQTRLKSLGIRTRELTGDMSMTEREISQTHIIVTTPEKWDVVTRKPRGSRRVDMLSLVRLLIIDEVHLLQSDRGPVLEALVARTLRYVESTQRMTRIIGLSATLPNYVDVATFLRVNPYKGLFYFDNRFRPVPLQQTFIGVRPLDTQSSNKTMDKICYNQVLKYVGELQKQVMIFVHARNATQRVASKLREMIQINNKTEMFQPDIAEFPEFPKELLRAKNSLLRDLFAIGFGIHHAGMIRADRLLVERLFRQGVLKVLVCTATLAWGVNFPAHAVIIRGTELYDASAGKFVDVGLLDVMQIFGRAGRPQYDTDGHAIIISSLEKMDFYLKLLTNQTPIESNFTKHLADNLNAEIVSGTVSTVYQGMLWLQYTYLNVRLAQNPLVYGCEHYEIESDPTLTTIRNRLIRATARQLNEAKMCEYNEQTDELKSTPLGRIASHFYINYETVSRFNELLRDGLEQEDLFGIIGEAKEFQQIKFREEEASELDKLRKQCFLPIADGKLESTCGKVSCLLQAYISRSYIDSHSLVSDLMYIAQNATRIARGLFEYSLQQAWPVTTLNLLRVCKMLELQFWDFQSPFRHFKELPAQVISRLEDTKTSIEQIETLSNKELGKLVCWPERMAQSIKDHLKQLPYVLVEGHAQKIGDALMCFELKLVPFFNWSNKYHGQNKQTFWMWIADEEVTKKVHYSKRVKFDREQVQAREPQDFMINVPLLDDAVVRSGELTAPVQVPKQYVVFVLSDHWNGCDYEFAIRVID